MSFRVVAKVLRESDERLARRLILLVLAEAASEDGIAWVGQEEVAAKARLSRTHVSESIGDMVADGAIELRKAKRGRRRINVYRLILPGLDEPDYDRLPFVLDEPFTTSEVPTPSEATASEAPSDDVGSAGSTTSESPTSRARDPLPEPLEDPSEDPDPSSLAIARDPETPPKLVKVDGRDQAFDALAHETGVDPSGNRAREVGIALNGSPRSGLALGIRALVWREARRRGVEPGEPFERFLVNAIHNHARSYRLAMRDAALTPLALAKWWTDLDRAGPRDAATAAAEEAVALRRAGR